MPYIIKKEAILHLCMDLQQFSTSLFNDSSDQTDPVLGFHNPACSYRGLKRPPEVCDPQLHLAASELIKTMLQATKMTGSCNNSRLVLPVIKHSFISQQETIKCLRSKIPVCPFAIIVFKSRRNNGLFTRVTK